MTDGLSTVIHVDVLEALSSRHQCGLPDTRLGTRVMEPLAPDVRTVDRLHVEGRGTH
jgi:hypothetical protein